MALWGEITKPNQTTHICNFFNYANITLAVSNLRPGFIWLRNGQTIPVRDNSWDKGPPLHLPVNIVGVEHTIQQWWQYPPLQKVAKLVPALIANTGTGAKILASDCILELPPPHFSFPIAPPSLIHIISPRSVVFSPIHFRCQNHRICLNCFDLFASVHTSNK